jgi:hypothetical protein
MEADRAKAADTTREDRERIARRRDDVFLTREFRDLGGEDQVLRALPTQVPVNPAVRVKGRFSRHLRYQDTELRLER